MLFITLKLDSNYEITEDVYPYIIRRKDNHKVVKIRTEASGYQRLTLSGESYYYHQVIAAQFLENPNNYTEIDHKDKHNNNNRISNLRYVPHSTNCLNKTSYNGVPCTYVNKLNERAIKIPSYFKYNLDSYWFDGENFYYYTGFDYRRLHLNQTKGGAIYVYARDTENKQFKIYLKKFATIYKI